LKYGEDSRIPDLHNKQLKKYYDLFLADYENIVSVYENIVKQKKAIQRWPYPKKDFKISRDKRTMRKVAIFGNIDEKCHLLKQAKKQFDGNTFFSVQNNILRENALKDRTE